ncbi:MAG: 4'-phosphopantetheinyl transferase superfamily protein [Lachnospiraceae bacterium]|nr:4'-phosphopantetheinyl transferase superfamily protein [Lachnospiraceae bacterium]
MWEACYFLDVSSLEFLPEERAEGGKHTEGRESSEEQVTLQKLKALLDEERLSKYQEIQNKKVAGASLGAGLLLRLAATELKSNCQVFSEKNGAPIRDVGCCLREEKGRRKRESKGMEDALGPLGENLRILSPEDVLVRMRHLPVEHQQALHYRYGKNGKPYWVELPYYFSLSHSGDLVALAVSGQEIGLDVQKVTGTDWKKLAGRFFAQEEQRELEKLCEISEELGRKEFFRLWCQKESYGKMTGEGLLPYLQKKVTAFENAVFLEKELELGGNGYFFALCKGRVNGREK